MLSRFLARLKKKRRLSRTRVSSDGNSRCLTNSRSSKVGNSVGSDRVSSRSQTTDKFSVRGIKFQASDEINYAARGQNCELSLAAQEIKYGDGNFDSISAKLACPPSSDRKKVADRFAVSQSCK
ncbi:hypothetical protein M8J75_015360 [Diaphorina citri]|nr:hypothetical protein M8J75_015360 [Diaphorina citri]